MSGFRIRDSGWRIRPDAFRRDVGAAGPGLGNTVAQTCLTAVRLPPTLVAQGASESGFAAPLCGKAPPFQKTPFPPFFPEQAGRLSLPAGLERVYGEARRSERRSLSQSRRQSRRLETAGWSANWTGLGCCPALSHSPGRRD